MLGALHITVCRGQYVQAAQQPAAASPDAPSQLSSYVQQHCFFRMVSHSVWPYLCTMCSSGEVSLPERRAVITLALFEEASSQQGPLPTGQAVWKEVRGRMAAAAGGRKALADECPASCIGVLLAMLLQQVRSICQHEVCPNCQLLPTDSIILAGCSVHILFRR